MSGVLRILTRTALVVLLLGAALFVWIMMTPLPPKPAAGGRTAASASLPPRPAAPRVVRAAAPPPPVGSPCDARAEEARAAAAANARSLDAAAWSPFGRAERGWRIYAPLVAHEIGAACPPDTPAFAARLAAWRARHALPPAGAMDEASFRRMAQGWLLRRPFQRAAAHGCPPPPPDAALSPARPEEGYAGKRVRALTAVLAAYRRMAARARADSAAIAADPRLLTIFSAFRGPQEEAARCADGSCNRLTKASCSVHRTGTALDLFVGAAPGRAPDSTDEADRRVLTASPAYLWLAANADRFGFAPYPFEPWHWEWVGEGETEAEAG